MTVRTELLKLVEKMNANNEHIKGEKDKVFQVNLNESEALQIVIQNGQVRVVDGTPNDPEVTLILSESNFAKLLKDDLNTTRALMTGGLKVEGKIGLALKLQEIVKNYQ